MAYSINKQIFETTLKEFKSTILNRPEKARGDLGTRFAIILLLKSLNLLSAFVPNTAEIKKIICSKKKGAYAE